METPTQAPVKPVFIASAMVFGTIPVPGRDEHALAIMLTDAAGNECPIVVTNDAQVFDDDQLVDQLAAAVKVISPDQAPPAVVCDGCGIRVFGEVAARGTCGDCVKAVER